MGDVFELIFFMWLIGALAFAPLAYFIYIYTAKNGEPFGDIEPHGDNGSAVADLVDKVLGIFQSKK